MRRSALRWSQIAGAPTRKSRRLLATMSGSTPVLDCRSCDAIQIQSSAASHPYQSPKVSIPELIRSHLDIASGHLHAGRTVAFPTETVYGLGAHSLDPQAVKRVYEIKNRPSDNPLIIHVSSLDMLKRLLPPDYTLSRLYQALISAFWPGPFTLLFPTPNPPPLPAPQTTGIRMPAHPLALALIAHSDLPISAPSANSSGRPSPTSAQHVVNDLSGKEGLGCILDGGECGVGVESTVVNGLNWKEGGGGSVDVLRPGGLGVEEIQRIVQEVDGMDEGPQTKILLHGKPWSAEETQAGSSSSGHGLPVTNGDAPPSTPGLKYRHYSPRIPVFLLLPSNTFPRPEHAKSSSVTQAFEAISFGLQQGIAGRKPRIGVLHYDDSPLYRRIRSLGGNSNVSVRTVSLGVDSTSAAQRLFSGMLQLEGGQSGSDDTGVDCILIEGCSDRGLGLAVMERIGKAVGGGGSVGGLGDKQDESVLEKGRIWVDVESPGA